MSLRNVGRYPIGIAIGICIAMALQEYSPSYVYNPVPSYIIAITSH